MARTRKSVSALNLYKYDVLIEDTSTRSDYFKISQFDGYFYGGRNAFLIAGAAILKPNSRILVEILDKDGKAVYSAPIQQFIEGNSRLVQVEVYNDTPIGAGKLVILGCTDRYKDGTPIPPEWRDKFNVRWSTDIIISPLVENKTPIRFEKTPSMAVVEKFYLEPSSSAYIQKIQVPLDVEIEPKYLNVFPNGYVLKVVGPNTDSRFLSDYIGGTVTGSLTMSHGTVTESLAVKLPITKVFNRSIAESGGELLYSSNKNLILGGFFSSSNQTYTTTLDPVGVTQVTGSFVLQYDKLETIDTIYDVSYARIRIVDLRTLSGEIHKIRLAYKPAAEPGEYVSLGDIPTDVRELFAVDSASKIAETGKFNDVVIDDYWYTATMSLQKNATEPITLPTYYNSSSLITSNFNISQCCVDLLDSVNATPPIVNGEYVNNVSYFIGNRVENSIALFPRSEYTLAFDAVVNRYSASIELTQQDYSLEVYLVTQESSGSTVLNSDPRGQLLGVLTPNKNFIRQNFETVNFNFIPNIKDTGNFGIRFVVYGGLWSIANVSVKTAREPFFSPDEVDILVQNVNYRNKVLTFKADYLDINNNSIGISTLSTPTYFFGSQTTPFDSSSVATSSFAFTASYAANGGNGFPFTGSAIVSGSFRVTGSISTTGILSASTISATLVGPHTGSTFGTASWALNAISSSFATSASRAITASYALNAAGGAGAGFPYNGHAIITGSMYITGSGSSIFEVVGTAGTLFNVSDGLTGSLMNISDISGIPIFQVFSDHRVVMGTLNSNTLVVTGSRIGVRKTVPTETVDISGSVLISGSLRVSSGITGSVQSASNAITASYALSGGSGTIPIFPYTGSAIISGSLIITGSISADISSAYALSAMSSSYALTASYALNGGGGGGGLSGGTTNYIPIWTSDSAQSSSTIFQSSNLIGIGTTTPTNKLTVFGDLAFTENTTKQGIIRLWQEADNSDFRVSHAIGVESFHNRYGAGSFYVNSIGHKFYRGGGEVIAQLGFGGAGTPSNRLDSYFAGNVGIGITNPTAKLHIIGNVLATSYTGSLSGSLSGSLFGTASWAENATSASYALSASYAPIASVEWSSVLNKPSGIVSSSTQVVELLPPNTVSSSIQINTGSFTGSFKGAFVGDGSGLTGITAVSTLAGRTTVSSSIPGILVNQTYTGSISWFGKSFMIFSTKVNTDVRVRLYGSQSYLTNDLFRPIGTDPSNNSGVIMDLVLSGSPSLYNYTLSPIVNGANMDPTPSATIYYAVTNLSTVISDISMSFNRIILE